MNKTCMFYAATISVIMGFVAGLFLHYYRSDEGNISVNNGARHIALFLPASHPAIDAISEGFVRTLKQTVDNVHITIFNANGNKTLLRAQSEEIISSGYALVCTIGAACTQTLKELTTKKQSALPIVFGAVGDPVGMHIVASLASSGNQVTGVYEGRDYIEQLAFLKRAKPHSKSVLLVFDPSSVSYFEQDKAAIAYECKKLGLHFQSLEVYNPNEISQKVPALLDSADTLLILKDHTTVGALDNLIKLCNQAGVTLYASDLNSGEKGAALSYGIQEEDTGIAAAHVAKEILNGRLPRDIPIEAVQPMKPALNIRVMAQQGITMPGEQDDLIIFGKGL